MDRVMHGKLLFALGCLMLCASVSQIAAALHFDRPLWALAGAVYGGVATACCVKNWSIWHNEKGN